jgi:riboflavin synthase
VHHQDDLLESARNDPRPVQFAGGPGHSQVRSAGQLRCGKLLFMFTGLVEGQGTVGRVTALPVGVRLTVVPDAGCFDVSGVQLGDSLAISGCCLTVIARRDGELDFEAGEETLAKTSLGRLQAGHRVNLERSLRADARLGGHFVQGHVDTTARVCDVRTSGDWTDLWFALSADHLRLLVPKGSVAVDGVSLTVVNVEAERFSVALIPHTLQVTTLGQRKVGDVVNIETDILGKYIDRLLEARLNGSRGGRAE